MPWHIRVSRAVACDNLQPRVNAHHWHIRAFFIGELPPNFLLQKTLSAQASLRSVPRVSLMHVPYFILYDLASVRCHLEFRSEHFTRTTAHEHAL